MSTPSNHFSDQLGLVKAAPAELCKEKSEHEYKE
jgi:hypothetical protein